jgi:hypothetical protein
LSAEAQQATYPPKLAERRRKRYPSWSERRRWVSRSAQPILRSVARRANHLGNLSAPVSSLFRKNILIFRRPKSLYIPRRPVPQGRLAIVTAAGRDAVDAGGAKDEGAFLRTEKSCGPDARRWRQVRGRQIHGRRWQESPVAGESAKETVKTIARGMPGDSGVTVVTNSRVFYTPREAAGALGARHSPRPLFGEGGKFIANLGRIRPRDRETMSWLFEN